MSTAISADLGQHLDLLGIPALDGFILDLGVSSHQLDSAGRGFSFQQDAPLDMRMDTSCGETAADLLNDLPEPELERIIRDYGEERWAKRIAAFIVKARLEAPIETTLQLVDIVKGAVPKAKWEERIHPATRTFQAVRIAVNRELENLEKGLTGGPGSLEAGGAWGRDLLPLAGRPDREAHLPGIRQRLHLPAELSGLRLQQQAAGTGSDRQAGYGNRAGDRSKPSLTQCKTAGGREIVMQDPALGVRGPLMEVKYYGGVAWHRHG